MDNKKIQALERQKARLEALRALKIRKEINAMKALNLRKEIMDLGEEPCA